MSPNRYTSRHLNPICHFNAGKTAAGPRTSIPRSSLSTTSAALPSLIHLTGVFPPPVATQSRPLTLSDWIDAITKVWRENASNTLELAGLLSRAKIGLRHGDWSRLWRGQLPFSKRKGEMLVVIGQTLGNLDAQNSAHLPSAWNTLYYLARLGRPLVEQLIQQGRIHPRLTLQEAKPLLAEYKPHLFQEKTRCVRVKQRLTQFAAFVQDTVATWSWQERRLAQAQLLLLLEEIELGLEASTNHDAQTQHTIEELAKAALPTLRKNN